MAKFTKTKAPKAKQKHGATKSKRKTSGGRGNAWRSYVGGGTGLPVSNIPFTGQF